MLRQDSESPLCPEPPPALPPKKIVHVVQVSGQCSWVSDISILGAAPEAERAVDSALPRQAWVALAPIDTAMRKKGTHLQNTLRYRMSIYTCIHTCTMLYRNLNPQTYVFMRICMCTRTHLHAHLYVRTFSHTHMPMHTHVYMHMCTYFHIHVQLSMSMCMYPCACIHV